VNEDNGIHRTVQTNLKADCYTEGTSNPRWRAAIKAGQIVYAPYTRVSFDLLGVRPFIASLTSNNGTAKEPSYSTGGVRGDSYILPSSAGIGSPARTKALTRAYKRISEQQTHAHGMQFLGELHEVIKQFKRPYSSAVKLVDSYLERAASAVRRYKPRSRHDNPKQALKNLNKALSDSWLETAFGLQPLISDTRDLAEAAARFSSDRRRDVVTASATVQVSGVTQEFITSFSGTNIRLTTKVREVETSSTLFRVFLDWSRSADMGSLARASELAGFRPDLFVPTIYELIPYSWLLDYVTNVGDIIETGCQSSSVVVASIETIKNMVVSEQIYTPSTVPASASREVASNYTPGRAVLRRKYFLRTGGLGPLPSVPFQLSLPGSPGQYANVAALWLSKISKIQTDWNTRPHKDVF
jgi:hypothetical protein